MRVLRVRSAASGGSMRNKVIVTFLFFLLGFALGMISKGLDVTPSNHLPGFIEAIDLSNMLGRVAIWALIALSIALFCKSPRRAAINVFVFFAGMLSSYCLFSVLWAGFMLDTSYLMVWVVLTVISPLLAFIAWYARGKGIVGIMISAVIIAYFILEAFSFDAGFSYFGISYSVVEVLFLAAIILMLYVGVKQCLVSVGAAIVLVYLVRLTGLSIPYIL